MASVNDKARIFGSAKVKNYSFYGRIKPVVNFFLHSVYHQMNLKIKFGFNQGELRQIVPKRVSGECPVGDIQMRPRKIRLNEFYFSLNFFKSIGVDGGNQHGGIINTFSKFPCVLSASPHSRIHCRPRKKS